VVLYNACIYVHEQLAVWLHLFHYFSARAQHQQPYAAWRRGNMYEDAICDSELLAAVIFN